MKRMFVGVVAIGAIVGLRSARRAIGQKMRDHCGEMARGCLEMATQVARRGEAVGRT